MEVKNYDIVIVGAGPSGCSCAYELAKKGLKIALLEKSAFPRDKICGDALSADVMNQFYKMDMKLAKQFEQFANKKETHGVRFFAPNLKCLDISFENSNHKNSESFVAKRSDFDHFFFTQIKDIPEISIFLNHVVEEVKSTKNDIVLKTNKGVFKAQIAIGADGANSILNKQLTDNKLEKNHHCAGLRQYFENVTGFHPNSHIELHFYKEVLPGYFWIFPLPNNHANVGLGMLSSEVSEHKINLKEKLTDIVQNHPAIKHRFKNAKPLETIRGYGLPMGSKKKTISGNRFLLLGDAASLIDPFTGEGIGNAIRSGRIAANHLAKAFEKNKFDAAFNKHYDKEIYRRMGKELRISYSLQKLLRYPHIFNFLVKKANRNSSVRILLTSMLDDLDLKKELLKPSFYFRLIFN